MHQFMSCPTPPRLRPGCVRETTDRHFPAPCRGTCRSTFRTDYRDSRHNSWRHHRRRRSEAFAGERELLAICPAAQGVGEALDVVEAVEAASTAPHAADAG